MAEGAGYELSTESDNGGEMMAGLEERLDKMEAAIHKPTFRENSGRANEVNFWVFDYDPARELEVRKRVDSMKKKNAKGTDGFKLLVFDLYDMIMDYLEERDFVTAYGRYEKKRGFDYIIRAVSTSLKMNEDDSILIRKIVEQTPENSIVFLTGVGKCYPLLRSHKILNNLHQSVLKEPVVLFFPGTYTEQELILLNEIKDDNYYRAFKLVK